MEPSKDDDRTKAPTSSAPSTANDGADEGTSSASAQSDEDSLSVESIRKYLKNLRFSTEKGSEEKQPPLAKPVLETVDFEGVVSHWKKNGFKNIITMAGAGISTSAGIPDFRSPGTGLYNNLQKYDLPHPTAIFELGFFKENPKPFFTLAKELYPGSFKPTPCHYFIKMLDEKGLLLRHYTQNIDTLERIVGINPSKLVEAHGTFFTNHCVKSRCRRGYTMEWMKEKIFEDKIPMCTCGGIIKPDIVFFGENLPNRFYELPEKDFKKCDLLIIMGTSLEVQPFASLTENTTETCVRLLINREIVGTASSVWPSFFANKQSLKFGMPSATRDVAWQGDCDDGVQAIADAMEFGDELKERVKKEHAAIDEKQKPTNDRDDALKPSE